MIIAFEGGEGSGKSSVIRRLYERLRTNLNDVICTHEPGGTQVGNAIRGILLDPANKGMADLTEVLLYQASRAQLVTEVLRPAQARGHIVLLDRFYLSTLAYQVAGRGLQLGPCLQAIELATGGLQADVTFLFDVEPQVGLARVGRRGKADRLEQEALAFHERVRDGFLAFGKLLISPLHVIDATRCGVDSVYEQVVERLRPYTGLKL
jgi:dTMP kinase